MAASTNVLQNRHDLAAEINLALIRFEKEFMGRGPVETQTYILDDMVLVRLKGVLTPTEQKLANSDSPRSGYLLKQVRNELLQSGRPLLEALMNDILNVPVQSIHTDISTKTGERIIVFTMKNKLNLDAGEPSRTANGTADRRRTNELRKRRVE